MNPLDEVLQAVWARDYAAAAAAAGKLGPIVGASGLNRGVVQHRLLQRIEYAGLDVHHGVELAIWLGCYIVDPDWSYPMSPPTFEPIRVSAGTLSAQVDAAEDALIGACLGLYQQGGAIVRVGYADGETLTVSPVDETYLLELIGRVTAWERYDTRSKADVAVSCPRDVPRAYLSRSSLEWRVPRLTGTIAAPTLREDGSVLDVPGYDHQTGLYLDKSAEGFPAIPDNPDQGDAWDAADTLLELIVEFPFVDLPDEAVALAAILTACIRRSLPAAPLFALTAPAPGTGKSLLVDVVNMIATGHTAAGLSWPDDQHEQRKQLDAALLAGASLIALDNVTAPLGGDRLNQMLTQQLVTVRRLGESKNVEVSCQALVTANGNNLAIAADLTRRTLLCRLDAGVECPELRQFNADPLALVRADRGRYVAAALTLLRAYHVAGRPNQPKPLGSFEVWSSWVRGALIWCGFADPVESQHSAREVDPRGAELAAILGQWDEVIGDRRVTSAQIIASASVGSEFREAVLAVAGAAGAINTQRLGKWLHANKARVVGGLRVEPAGQTRAKVATWRLVGGRNATDVVDFPIAHLVAAAE